VIDHHRRSEGRDGNCDRHRVGSGRRLGTEPWTVRDSMGELESVDSDPSRRKTGVNTSISERDATATAAESWSAVGGVLLIERFDRSDADFEIGDGTGRQLGESRS